MGNTLLDLMMSVLNPTEKEIARLNRAVSRFPRQLKAISEAINQELNTPPRIALIGKTGVGKSSTINALFNPVPPLAVGAVAPTTAIPTEITIPLGGERGSIIVVDGPGLGASRKLTQQILPLYAQVIPRCDLVLWIIKADDKALEADQDFLEKILTPELKKRLVVGINQVDKIDPGGWNTEFNLPSPQQEKHITQKEKLVRKLLADISLTPKIVSYSAFYSYRLAAFLTSMLNACPKTRGWVIQHKAKLSPYDSPALQKQRAPGGAKGRK